MLHQTFLFLGQLWQFFEVSQILEFLRYPNENQTWVLLKSRANKHYNEVRGVFDEIFSYFSWKPYVVISHHSDEGSQHMFLCRINKDYPKLSLLTPSDLELMFRCT